MKSTRDSAVCSASASRGSDRPRAEHVVTEVRGLVRKALRQASTSLGGHDLFEKMGTGKMLRTLLAARLWQASPTTARSTLSACCAATELVHTATLLHDDVIDSGLLRRGKSALWVEVGPTAAVLTGDVLLCEAMTLLSGLDAGRWIAPFAKAVRATCQAEVEQDVRSGSGAVVAEGDRLRIAGGKTGPLFAFPARVAGAERDDLAAVLESVGYRIGMMYQLMDDLLDAVGHSSESGKTLGSDARLARPTMARAASPGGEGAAGAVRIHRHVQKIVRQIACDLAPWPECHQAVRTFLEVDVGARAAMERLGLGFACGRDGRVGTRAGKEASA